MTDSRTTAHALGRAWLALGRRLAVAAGALAGLLSLHAHAPVWVASLRGGLTFIAVLLLAKLSRALLGRTLDA
ncbi:MAG TPA: hypothetical protein VMS76_07075 [Planctomycetota bacterium]|nr:hypothetical protein [Planctomycetota bacterium]